MSIRLNRKKLLCVSFFLCCVLPACFVWFSVDEAQWRGMSMSELPLLVSTSLFAFALMFERARYMLPLGIGSHLLLLGFSLNNLISFPLISGVAAARDLSLSMDAVRPMYWVALSLMVLHLALFTTTELAMQRLTRQIPSAAQENNAV